MGSGSTTSAAVRVLSELCPQKGQRQWPSAVTRGQRSVGAADARTRPAGWRHSEDTGASVQDPHWPNLRQSAHQVSEADCNTLHKNPTGAFLQDTGLSLLGTGACNPGVARAGDCKAAPCRCLISPKGKSGLQHGETRLLFAHEASLTAPPRGWRRDQVGATLIRPAWGCGLQEHPTVMRASQGPTDTTAMWAPALPLGV